MPADPSSGPRSRGLPPGLFEELVDAAPDGIVVVDRGGSVLLANRQISQLLGYLSEDIIGRSVDLLLPLQYRGVHAAHREEFAQNPATRPMGLGALRARRSDGSEVEVDVSLAPIRVGGLSLTAAIIRDATGRLLAQERLEHLALHDALTGLPNRALLADRLDSALARQSRASEGIGLLFVDVDRLKQVNDAHGHDAGDRLLEAVGARVASVFRPSDTVARFGGDEFVVLVEQVRALADLEELARRMLAEVREPLQLPGARIRPSVSAGLAYAEPGTMDADALVRAADVAMYRAKRSGRDRYAIALPRAGGGAQRMASGRR